MYKASHSPLFSHGGAVRTCSVTAESRNVCVTLGGVSSCLWFYSCGPVRAFVLHKQATASKTLFYLHSFGWWWWGGVSVEGLRQADYDSGWVLGPPPVGLSSRPASRYRREELIHSDIPSRCQGRLTFASFPAGPLTYCPPFVTIQL